MALDGQQHVGEPAENVRTNGLALIGTGHASDLVSRDAEMIGPEPDQPLRQSDVCVESRFGAKLRFFKIDRPPWVRNGVGSGLFRHLLAALRCALDHGRLLGHLLSFRVLFSLGDDRSGLLLRIKIGNGAQSHGT